ncbi:MAG: SGNH/GDSL hydrolase family protein [Sneathiellaceae bacterium]
MADSAKGSRGRKALVGVLAIVLSTVAGLLISEAAFRAYVYVEDPGLFRSRVSLPDEFAVYRQSLWQFDARHGYTYPPGVVVDISVIRNGVASSCNQLSYINDQGNVGPPMNDHADPDYTVAVFGDSWTASHLEGKTWPHLLRAELEARTGKKINVYNFGRDGTGMIHMFRLAEEKLPQVKPDLAIVAFISDDLDRDMFWRTETEVDGEMRILTTVDPSPNPDMAQSADTVLAFPEASLDWCNATKGRRDDRVAEIEEKYLRVLDHAYAGNDPRPSLTTLSHSYIYNFIKYADPVRFSRTRFRASQNPRLKVDSYEEVPGFADSVAAAKASGVPVRLVHLAIYPELLEGKEYILSEQGERLLASMERMVGSTALETTDYVPIPADPARMNQTEENYHPSLFGMEVYARAVAGMILENGLLAPSDGAAGDATR